uniref:DNA-directed RNA polymerase n=1 Tax=Strongyloides venezuelensis TaxID=75913 RepID=A0A0K0G5X5_STRVS
IDLALKKSEFFYERKCIEKNTSALTSYFEKVVNFICDKLNMNDNLVSPFSSIGVNKNGIFSTIENEIVSYIVSIGGITLFKTLSFRDVIFYFCIHIVVLRHLIITERCRFFYKLVCHLASIPVYAKKNRGKKFELPERIVDKINIETVGIVDFAMEH